MKRFRWMLIPIVLSLGVSAFADPAPGAGGGGRGDERAHEMRSRVLREKVGLNDDKAHKVESILDKYAPERKRIAKQLKEAREKLRALITLNSDDQGAYHALLQQVLSERKAMQDLMDRAFADVAKELTAKEQARLFLALQDIRGKFLGGGRGGGGARRWGPDKTDDDAE